MSSGGRAEKMLSNIIKAEQNSSNLISPLELNVFNNEDNDIESSASDIPGRYLASKEKKPDIDEIKKVAFEEGFNQGKTEGIETGRKEAGPVIRNFLNLIGELALFKQKVLNSCETDVVELIVAATKKIVQKEISLDKEIAATVLKNALKSLTDRKDILVRVNPTDYNIIHDRKAEYFGDIDGLRDITFVEDELVSQGGCMIESKFGEVDARIEKQIESLEAGLKNAIEK